MSIHPEEKKQAAFQSKKIKIAVATNQPQCL